MGNGKCKVGPLFRKPFGQECCFDKHISIRGVWKVDDSENGFGFKRFKIRFMTGFNYKMKLHVMQVRNVTRAFFSKIGLDGLFQWQKFPQPTNERT